MSVTRKLLVIGLVILFLVGVNSQFVEAVDTIVRRKVGVVEFKGDVAEKYRQSATNILAKTLHDFGRFEVIDRTEMDRVLEEQKFQHSGLVDQSTAVEIGKLIAADIIAVGTVNNISVEKKTRSWEIIMMLVRV